ncbi:maltose alpha-D-glucosyltransferase [Desulfuromonas sp. TF]|uniref:maltose alpha-D-glucosyltransferase n=1 Tax=Desulfuromonas sp. TF TaxID=1232410 RepID=UPI0004180F2B|nr:maltose alpha-D-glucosyltransferase [Desulfuromonas sp. TF]
MPSKDALPDDNPQWYRDALIYQLHVKAFHDSDGNGIGDFRGLMEKLDYLHDLGITAVWLLPFYPSPLRDDGYDIADYYRVNPSYNTLADFKRFLKAAHARGIRVITELVLNHTSDQHPWFQRARRARPGSVHRNYYVWSDTPEKYRDARIIFQDFETSNWSWDPVAKAYYWHRFYAHQPDLNFESPAVQREMFRVIDFWFGMGVDGVRLDAVPYLFEREGTNCENLPETHAFLKKLRAHVDAGFKDRMLLAEANQWPEDAVAYFGEGDECHMAFHFPIMPRMYMALQMEDRFPLIDILEQTPAIPDSCQWAIFLRNHDELTLEMVTDEERDYMYRVYASDPRARINLGIRRRLAPLLANSRRRIELMNFLLFSLPGTPIIYYGDEIGMGDNYYLGDRDGVRTPMQWSPDRNAGFSRVNPQRLYMPVVIEPEYHYESVNVENQVSNTTSLLWWMRRVISMRKRLKALGSGTMEMLLPDNPKVLAFIRSQGDEILLVVVNLSRFAQVARLDLSGYAGLVPEEVFSRNLYPVIRKEPYILTLGVHDYYWFHLRPTREQMLETELPRLSLRSGSPWEAVLKGKTGERFADLIADYLPRCRWFRSKARLVSQVELVDSLPLGTESRASRLVLFKVSYTEGLAETYLLPLAWLPREQAERLLEEEPRARIAFLNLGDEEGMLFDAVHDENFRDSLLQLIARRRKLKGERGELAAAPGSRFRELRGGAGTLLPSRVLKTEQSNSSVQYGDRFFLKLYRQPDTGINPDPEITRFLTEKARFPRIPPFAGLLEYHLPGKDPMTIGLLQGYVSNQGDAWGFTLDVLSRYIERVLTLHHTMPSSPEPCPSLFDCDYAELPEKMHELIGTFYLEMAALLGRRTAEMHRALAVNTAGPVWRPEEFSLLYQRSVYQSMRSLCRRSFQALAQNLDRLTEKNRAAAEGILTMEKEILLRFGRIRERKLSASKIRIHGDYHLGQVLFTGKDFIIIDFEGEPARTLSERRLKRSPLRDVAGMIRSFHYAAFTALHRHVRNHSNDQMILEPWLKTWYTYVAGAFLDAYRQQLGETELLPAESADVELMLNAYLLEKAVYELGYELNNRPDWVAIPMNGIEIILGASTGASEK